MGGGGEPLRLKLRDREALPGTPWPFGRAQPCFATITAVDMVYAVELNRWNGQERLHLNVLDMRAAGRIP